MHWKFAARRTDSNYAPGTKRKLRVPMLVWTQCNAYDCRLTPVWCRTNM